MSDVRRELAEQQQKMQQQMHQQQQLFESLVNRMLQDRPTAATGSAAANGNSINNAPLVPDGGEQYTTVSMRDAGISVSCIQHETPEEAGNSWYKFEGYLRALNLESIATEGPLRGASDANVRGPKAARDLDKLLDQFVKDDNRVISSLRSTFPHGGSSFDKLKHVYDSFISTMEVVQADAAQKISSFDWAAFAAMDGKRARETLIQFNALVRSLDSAVRGNEGHWIRHINRHLPASTLAGPRSAVSRTLPRARARPYPWTQCRPSSMA